MSAVTDQLPGFMVSAPWRSSGKTMITLSLSRLLAERQLKIQTFKKGPDYIDPQWLAAASGRHCYNLDPYMQTEAEWIKTYQRQAGSCSLALVEGTMGLHDGLATDGSDSNASVALLLDLPVILVVDCRGMHRTVAALINGIVQFNDQVEFAGVVLNRIRSDRHASKIQRALETYTDITLLGSVPEVAELAISEKELGLIPQSSCDSAERKIACSAEMVKRHCDLDFLLSMAAKQVSTENVTPLPKTNLPGGEWLAVRNGIPKPASECLNPISQPGLRYKIAIIKDAAFNFYYQDDLDELCDRGADLVEVSALDGCLPNDIDGLIIGGGFPERYAGQLQENAGFRQSVARLIKNGLAVHAECAGLMYLCRDLQVSGQLWDMVGVIDGSVTMHKKPRGRGYMALSKMEAEQSLPQLANLTAHEFHHSQVSFTSPQQFVYRVSRGYGIDGEHDGVAIYNTVATYAHFRHTTNTPWIDWFMERVDSFCCNRGLASRV